MAKREKKWKMTYELAALLPPDVHDAWPSLTTRERDMIARSVLYCEEKTRDLVSDSYYDSMAGYCDRPHSDD